MITLKTYARKEVYGSPTVAPTGKKVPSRNNKASAWQTKIFRGNISLMPLKTENTEGSLWPVKTEFINELHLRRGKVDLSWPLRVDTVISGNYFIMSNEDLDVHSYGDTQEESQQNFCEIFEEMLDLYVGSRADELTGDAVRIKALFDRIIKQ